MSLTNFLLIVIVAILIRQFYPDTADTIVVLGIAAIAIYGVYWLVAIYPKHRVGNAQRLADENEFCQYLNAQEAIRTKWDPSREWNETTSVPDAYLAEIRALNLKHAGMLRRRNDWTDSDFKPDQS